MKLTTYLKAEFERGSVIPAKYLYYEKYFKANQIKTLWKKCQSTFRTNLSKWLKTLGYRNMLLYMLAVVILNFVIY